MRVKAALLVIFLVPTVVRAGGPYRTMALPDSAAIQVPLDPSPSDGPAPENTRLVSSSLALLLGPFGAHRLYLGTTPKVPIIYGITFGGFGLLALIDLGHLLFSHELEPYRHNDRVFMWGRNAPAPTPP